MRTRRRVATALVLLCGFAGVVNGAPPPEPTSVAADATVPANAVAVWRGEWHDPARDRTLPIKIYYPARTTGPAPAIVFSHGLGASRETYAYLGEYWAAHGYVSVHVQHPGSDAEVMADAAGPLDKLRRLKRAAEDQANQELRPRDLRFAIDELERLSAQADSPLQWRIDPARIGVAGHSFGAYTVLAVAGQAVGPAGAVRYFGPDPRVKAAVAMSAGVPQWNDLDRAYERITIPVFHLTGTRDQVGEGRWHGEMFAAIGAARPEQRRTAFDHTWHGSAYLLTFRDGDHRLFANARGGGRGGEHDAEYQRIICHATTAFWDATLRGDDDARRWFEGGGLATLLGEAGVFELKKPVR